MKRGLGMSNDEIGDVMAKWNKGVLDSFLIEITRDVMYFKDDDGEALVEKILDSAGQKGTGKWTAINALDLGMPVTLIGEAVFARCLSSLKSERAHASTVLDGPTPKFDGDRVQLIANLEQALYASKIISYAQGFMLIQNVGLVPAPRRRTCLLPLPSIASLTPTPLRPGRQELRLEAQQAVDRSHVAWRLHHPVRVPEGHHLGIPERPGPGKSALR